jgi:hypothetical protein
MAMSVMIGKNRNLTDEPIDAVSALAADFEQKELSCQAPTCFHSGCKDQF